MINLLKAHKVIICAGTGGVGKTTMAASLGVLAAKGGLRTLVLTIDPAKRLAQAMGLEGATYGEVLVPSVENLYASMIDPRREFDEFVLGSVDKGIAKGLFNNRLYQQLVSNLNGSQEFTSLVKLLNVVKSEKYDLVLLDTPPTQNAVDFLKAPERIYALFQDTVIGWFANPEADEGWLKRAFHRGTRLVTSSLESVTGSTFIGELKDFFRHVSFLKSRISAVSHESQLLLRAETTGFLLVTGFDENKLLEALEFQSDLAAEKLNLRAIIVNRWFPEWSEGERGWQSSWDHDTEFMRLKEFHEVFSHHFKSRQEAFERFRGKIIEVPVLKLPEFSNTVQGVDDLGRMAAVIEARWREK